MLNFLSSVWVSPLILVACFIYVKALKIEKDKIGTIMLHTEQAYRIVTMSTLNVVMEAVLDVKNQFDQLELRSAHALDALSKEMKEELKKQSNRLLQVGKGLSYYDVRKLHSLESVC